MLEFIMNHYKDVLAWIAVLIGIATVIATITPSGKDDTIIQKIGNMADHFGINLANMRPKMPKALDGIPTDKILDLVEKYQDLNDVGQIKAELIKEMQTVADVKDDINGDGREELINNTAQKTAALVVSVLNKQYNDAVAEEQKMLQEEEAAKGEGA